MNNKSIFVTVGTTKFTKLITTVLLNKNIELFKKLGFNKMTLQIGNDDCEYNMDYEDFIVTSYKLKDSIIPDMLDADLIISHGGVGTCLEVLDLKKPLLIVVNADLMDNHQIEIADKLSQEKYAYCCTCDTFNETLVEMDIQTLKLFPKGDSSQFFKYLEDFLENSFL